MLIECLLILDLVDLLMVGPAMGDWKWINSLGWFWYVFVGNECRGKWSLGLLSLIAAEGAAILQPMGPPAKGLGQWQAQLKKQYLTEIGTADMIGLGHMTLAALGRAGVGWLRGCMDVRHEDVVARTRPLLPRRFSVDDQRSIHSSSQSTTHQTNIRISDSSKKTTWVKRMPHCTSMRCPSRTAIIEFSKSRHLLIDIVSGIRHLISAPP